MPYREPCDYTMRTVEVNSFYPTRPHAKQQEVLDHSGRFKVLVAGRKWRKTSLAVSWLMEQAMTTSLSYPYIAPSRVQAKNIVWDDHISRLLEHFRVQGFPYKTNESELSVEFPISGGKLQLFGVENKESLRGISNWGAVVCDEYDDWGEDIWPLIIRPNLIPNKAAALICGTPKGKRGLWRLSQNPDWAAFQYSTFDNPDIDREELESLAAEFKQYGIDYYNQEILAKFVKPQGTVYKEWDELTQLKEFDYDPNLPLHRTWDFGINDATSVIWIQPYGGEFRVVDYYEASDADISHFVAVCNNKPYRKATFDAGDIAGRARSLVTGKSVIDELKLQGINVRTSPIPDIPTQIRHAHKFIPSLFVAKKESTERFVDVLSNYKYPASKSEKTINQSNEIPLHDQFSHGARALEYYFWNVQAAIAPVLADLPDDRLFDSDGFY
jgi:phage terminase large subunit